jgi:hypothetical protein
MKKRRTLIISVICVLLLPIILMSIYLLIQGNLSNPSKLDLLTLFSMYLCGVPIAIVTVIVYLKSRKE